MDISTRGVDLIVSFEGKKKLLNDGTYCAYLDTLAKPNIPTIYCGLTRGIKMGLVITEAQGEQMFRRELASYEDAVEKFVKVPLNQHQFDALVSFVYNCGPGALQKSTLLKLLNKEQYDRVPNELLKWNKAGGVVYAGLTRRRIAEGALFATPMPHDTPEASPVPGVETLPADHMPQQVQPNNPAMLSTMAGSKTVLAAGTGLCGMLVQAWDWLTSAAKTAGPDILANQQALSPFEALFKQLGTNMGAIAAMIVVGSLVAVIYRRVMQDRA